MTRPFPICSRCWRSIREIAWCGTTWDEYYFLQRRYNDATAEFNATIAIDPGRSGGQLQFDALLIRAWASRNRRRNFRSAICALRLTNRRRLLPARICARIPNLTITNGSRFTSMFRPRRKKQNLHRGPRRTWCRKALQARRRKRRCPDCRRPNHAESEGPGLCQLVNKKRPNPISLFGCLLFVAVWRCLAFTERPSRRRTARPQCSATHFEDITRAAGIHFTHNSGAIGKKVAAGNDGAGRRIHRLR